MTEHITQRELRNKSGRIMRALDERQSFLITRRSEPVGELRPLRRHRFVDRSAVMELFRAAPAVDRDEFFADLDLFIDQDPEPRG